MKKILGLDLGTNSIGWAVVNAEQTEKSLMPKSIEMAGSRIIPMDAAEMSDFEKGNSKSQTAERTRMRGVRRLGERDLLRRERIHRVLHLLGFLPEHYETQLGWDKSDNKTYGKFKKDKEPKLAWKETNPNKFDFLFQESFNEMLSDFREYQPDLVANGKKVPYDWTIYFLRKKALEKAITKEELAWIILNFNQKRGYYQLRGEELEESPNKKIEYQALKVIRVEKTEEKKGMETWYNVHLENGWIYRRPSKEYLDWEGKTKEFIVTTDINDDGTPKLDNEGSIKRSFRAPKEDDWTLMKKKTESDIEKSFQTVGTYIYNTILQKPNQKIRGKLVRTIERKYYKSELYAIIKKQIEFHKELQSKELYNDCILELYPNNESHRNNIKKRDFTYLIVDDIIFYQRPLKSKKSLIANCPFEEHIYKDKTTKVLKKSPIKCIAKSHPLYQEFRLWQFIYNIKIYQKERNIELPNSQLELFSNPINSTKSKLETDVDVTAEFLKNDDDYVALYEWLNDRKEVDQKAFLKYPEFELKKNADNFRWNYVEDKPYPCNKTRNSILAKLTKDEKLLLTRELEEKIWHLLYSVTTKAEIDEVFKDKGQTKGIYLELKSVFTPETIEKLKGIKIEEKDYGSYSEKAIKKILPLMRRGKYWSEDNIDKNTKERISKLVNGEYDEKIKTRVHEKSINLNDISHFKSLPLWLASYVVYDRHSEAKEITKWETPDDIDNYLNTFKQHSLRNPIVEQVILETLRTVRDIWKKTGRIDEIHVELGRDMKNPAEIRAKMTKQIAENENTNLRIKAILIELMNPEFEVENVRPFSPSQQEIFRIYEEYALNSIEKYDETRKTFVPDPNMPEFVSEIIQKFKEIDQKKRPTKSEILRYKLWLEQRYRSPYTGEMIPLGKLFTSAYEIEHIIPQSRYFDDSFSNKVICEAEVNKLKDNALGYEFIKNHHGEKVELNFGKTVEIFSIEAYENFVKDNYSRTKGKMKKLLMDEIPDTFIERQLNDSRYISKEIKRLLSNIVRVKENDGEYEQESVSKNLISVTGGITDRLKKDWGMNDVWNKIVLPRFIRLNNLMGTNDFTALNQEGHLIPSIPLELQRGFNKKRIDHRHHAMDAIVISCTTRDHVNLLNNESAISKNNANRYQLSRKLRRYEKTIIERKGERKEIEVAKEFIKPWNEFLDDAFESLENITVSFKQNLRVINKATNKFESFNDKDGNIQIGNNGKPEKKYKSQTKGDSWAIRKSMHKDTVFGKVILRKIKEVRISIAIENPQMIVDKELKNKINELLSKGFDAVKISSYFKENKEIWSEVNSSKIKVYFYTDETNEKYFATRKPIDQSFDKAKIENSVTDTGIQKILLRHLEKNQNNPELAFSPDGIDDLNCNIKELNDGKFHQPIHKIRWYEKADKFSVGQTGNKIDKFVEAAKGTNLFFAIYWNEDKKKREFETIPLNVVIEHQKKVAHLPKHKRPPVPINEEKGKFLFSLSPNDLVYVPSEEELESSTIFKTEDFSKVKKGRIYKMVSSTGNECQFLQNRVANLIKNYDPKTKKGEFGSLNKMEIATSGERIKEVCWKLNIDRLGNIVSIINHLGQIVSVGEY